MDVIFKLLLDFELLKDVDVSGKIAPRFKNIKIVLQNIC